MGIKSFFFNKKIKSNLKKHTSSELKKVESVAIIVDEKSAFNDFYYKKLQQLMALEDARFSILTIKRKKSNYNEFKGVVLFTNEINWTGSINSKELELFNAKKYDLLIDFIAEKSTFKDLIVSLVDAKMKVGYAQNSDELYNMVLKVKSENVDLFMSELVKYLKILKVI